MDCPSALAPPRHEPAGWRVLLTMLLAALAAAMTVLADREPARESALRCGSANDLVGASSVPAARIGSSGAVQAAPSATASGSIDTVPQARCLRQTVAGAAWRPIGAAA